ncbi:protein PML-like [Protobothrops mucrosquamatus]|uniref:protein PML-like n=1 Tax=Protobothrops mucrosquamatus TaxID=103944 RepID=UPI00077577D4|nr:protein PML-like [Protobothrops mucrosquamatus]
MAEGAASAPEPSASHLTEMNKELQFLLCDECHLEVPHPKLLLCFHNLCSPCLEKKPPDLCVICGTPYVHLAETPEKQDNVFFANLQVNFDLYQKVTGSKESVCNKCRKEAEFWCFRCKEFLCLSCFQFHQRYTKKDNHKARPLKDFQAESCKDFLSTIRMPNNMFCSKEGHSSQILSLYCKQCSQPMCAISTLPDSKQHCDISQEIQCKQELQNMNTELKEKKNTYDETNSSLKKLLMDMEQLRNEMTELIQQKIEQMIQWLGEKGKGFLAKVEAHHSHQVQEVNKKLQETKGVVKRITSSQRLVEKLQLYASGQEVLEMHPFLKMSMVDLKKKQPSSVRGIEMRTFLEIKAQLQTLLDRVTKNEEADPAKAQTEPPEELLGKSPLKRKYAEGETNTDSYPKILKIESLTDEEWNASAVASCSCLTMDEPGTSYGSTGGGFVSRSQGGLNKNPDDGPEIADGCSDLSDPEENSSMNVSSEEKSTDDETGASVLPLDINPTSPVGQKSPMKYPCSTSEDLSLESKIIFFDLKFLSGNILHLVALGEEILTFSVKISCLKNTDDKVCVDGLDEFLEYLSTLHRPIFVGYKLWSMEVPALLDALRKINKEKQFEESIFGFLDVLPFIREKFPENPNYTLKKLDKMYRRGQLDCTKAADCALALKDLCTFLKIIPVTPKKQVIACSSFRCYSSLQPLWEKKVLTQPSRRTLALHNISLLKLQSIYQNDPEKGLKKLCRRLNAKRRTGEKKIQRLSKIRSYFQSLPSSSQCSSLPQIC